MPTITVEEQIKKIKAKFPFDYNGIKLCLLSDEVEVIRKPQGGYHYILDVVDNEGYKYKIRDSYLKNSKHQQSLNKCFYNNPYTYDNIDNFCVKNNIKLKLLHRDFPLSAYAREKLDFVDGENNIHKISWNQLQHYYYMYQEGYEEVKRRRFEDTHMTKEKAIPIILAKYNELQRPLLQRDFMGVETTDNSIGIRPIRDIWGTFTNMLRDLDLPEHDYYYKPFDKNYRPHEEIINSIKMVCETVKSQGRTTILYPDFKKIADIGEISTIRRHCELDGTTLRDMVELYGCKLQQSGNGMNHRFEDGEYTSSKYEYDFSVFLRDNGFEYGKTYFRNIYYKKLDDEYKGNMNCDYCIDFGGQVVYIELAGILGNKEHQEAYKNNIPLKSKSKEEYRQKLNQKREIFERNNLEYYILLKDEMNKTTYKNILNKYCKEAA